MNSVEAKASLEYTLEKSIAGCCKLICSFHFVLILLPMEFCALLVHNAGYLRTQVMYEDLCTNVKGKYCASGNLISTAEVGRKFVFLLY